ncbi:Asp23/Gls24 family envelope stress response protein [Clostridium sp. BJN0001]|uniref:Asp23/Gls24 family envelope stress response protein n=1 Tax=Clostridium sp. BJN0001 TaxID=2930219 RepID=UPI001FD19FD1|nr:Asp23/Gls24 family envelope stress response protein [Clostridium sp. BJN0001]
MEDVNGNENTGVVRISDEVVSVIAGVAAQEIDGICDYQKANIPNIFKGKKAPNKAAKVTLEDDKAIIDMNVTVEYGVRIMDTIAFVQENVKKTVEAMTGIKVEAVNVCVQSICLPKKEQTEAN